LCFIIFWQKEAQQWVEEVDEERELLAATVFALRKQLQVYQEGGLAPVETIGSAGDAVGMQVEEAAADHSVEH